MTDGSGLVDIVPRRAHRLLRKSLEREDACKKRTRRHPLVDLKANGLGPVNRRNVAIEHPLDMMPRADLVSLVVQRDADHPIADRDIGGVGLLRSEPEKPLSQLESRLAFGNADATGPEAVQRPQLVLRVAEALGHRKGVCPR